MHCKSVAPAISRNNCQKFEAFCTAFGTAGTGGFGVKNNSIAGYSPYLDISSYTTD